MKDNLYSEEVRIDTLSDARAFVDAVTDVRGPVTLIGSNGYRVNAKSLLGALCSMEFEKVYCISEEDISGKIIKFIV